MSSRYKIATKFHSIRHRCFLLFFVLLLATTTTSYPESKITCNLEVKIANKLFQRVRIYANNLVAIESDGENLFMNKGIKLVKIVGCWFVFPHP